VPPVGWRCIELASGWRALVGPGAQLSGANFYSPDSAALDGVDLRDADLREANLKNTSLRFANLRGARLDGAQLAGAVTTRMTTCPNGAPGPCTW
jgi:hypothetical protein